MSVVRCQFRKTASGMYRAFQRKSSCLNELKRERTNVNTRRRLTSFNKSYDSSWHEAKRAEDGAIRSKHCGSGESDIGHRTFTVFQCRERHGNSMLPSAYHPRRRPLTIFWKYSMSFGKYSWSIEKFSWGFELKAEGRRLKAEGRRLKAEGGGWGVEKTWGFY